jgi:hypothetical protein
MHIKIGSAVSLMEAAVTEVVDGAIMDFIAQETDMCITK